MRRRNPAILIAQAGSNQREFLDQLPGNRSDIYATNSVDTTLRVLDTIEYDLGVIIIGPDLNDNIDLIQASLIKTLRNKRRITAPIIAVMHSRRDERRLKKSLQASGVSVEGIFTVRRIGAIVSKTEKLLEK